MPILSGSVTFSRFAVQYPDKSPSDEKRWFGRGLKSHAFEAIDRRSEDDRAAGFVELEDSRSTEFPASAVFHGERALFSWRVDQLRIPAAELKEELTAWLQTFERENDRRASRTEKNQARAKLKEQLRSKARIQTKTHDIAWNLKTNQVQIWTTSRKLVEEIAVAIQTGFDVSLDPMVPAHFARAADIAEDALSPTPALVGGEAFSDTVPEGTYVEA